MECVSWRRVALGFGDANIAAGVRPTAVSLETAPVRAPGSYSRMLPVVHLCSEQAGVEFSMVR